LRLAWRLDSWRVEKARGRFDICGAPNKIQGFFAPLRMTAKNKQRQEQLQLQLQLQQQQQIPH